MMLKKHILSLLLFGAFFLHLTHQVIPHQHHVQTPVVTHSHDIDHEHHYQHHDDHKSSKQEESRNWLNDILSFIQHGQIESPIPSGNQIESNFCKAIAIISPQHWDLQDCHFSVFTFTLPYYSPPQGQPPEHCVLFKCRRGPPVMA
jgi:hypothetical protein